MKLILMTCQYAAKYTTLCSLPILFVFASNTYAQGTTFQKSANEKTGFKKTFYGQASFYSNKFNGRKTASGEIFSQKKMTCASNILRLGTWIKVTNLRNGKSAVVKVNDRLHPSMKRIVDLTSAAAKQLSFTDAGLTRVRVEVIGKKKPIE
jgi:rare lipoprotein A